MDEQIVLDIDTSAAMQKLQQLATLYASNTQQINANKAALKDLNQQLAAGTISQQQYGQQVVLLKGSTAELTAQNKQLEVSGRQIVAATEAQTNAIVHGNGSIVSMRKEVTNLQQQYQTLSKAERESAAGQEMLKHLQTLESETRAAEKSMGNFKTSIGDYPEKITAMIPGFDKLSGVLSKVGIDMNALATGGSLSFATLGKAVSSFGKMFLTPPIIIIAAVLGAIVFVISKVSEAFKENDTAGTKLKAAFAAFTPVINVIKKAFEVLANVIASTVKAVADAASFLVGLVSKSSRDAMKAASDSVNELDALEDKKRQLDQDAARNDLNVAALRDQAAKMSDPKKKLELLQKAYDIEKQLTADKMNYANAVLTAEINAVAVKKSLSAEEKAVLAKGARDVRSLTQEEMKIWDELSDDIKNKLVELGTASVNATTTFFSETRRMVKEMEANKQKIEEDNKAAAAAAQQAAQEAARLAKERKDRSLQYFREQQEAALSILKDGIEKEKAELDLQAKNKIEDLKKRLTEEKGLTKADRENINSIILATEQKLIADKAALDAAAKKENLEREFAAQGEIIEIQIAAAKKGSEAYYQLRTDAIIRLMQNELANTELIESEKIAIQQKYQAQLDALMKEQDAAAAAEAKLKIANDYQEKVDMLYGQDAELAALELEEAKNRRAALDQVEFDSAEARRAANIAADEAIAASQRKVDELQKTAAISRLQAYSSMANSVTDLFSKFSEDNEKLAEFQLALSLGNIALATAVGIAEAVKAGSDAGPFPLNLAAIAMGVAAVTAGIGGAYAAIKQYNAVKAPKFADGGTVGGSSFSGDKVLARLNSGEKVLNTSQQNRLDNVLFGNGSPAGIDYEALSLSLAGAVEKMPAPVMDYKEFTEFQQKTAKYKEYANI